jgi:hypothetical protein
MDAIIGRYRANMEETGMLLLQHPAGIAFDLTADEVLELLDFLQVYQKTLLMLTRQTDAQLKSVVVEKEEEQNSRA